MLLPPIDIDMVHFHVHSAINNLNENLNRVGADFHLLLREATSRVEVFVPTLLRVDRTNRLSVMGSCLLRSEFLVEQ